MSDLTLVIPTFGREAVLVETLRLALAQHPAETIVVDQTPEHEPATAAELAALAAAGSIRLIWRRQPSIPMAMNVGLLAATRPVVLFADDDIVPAPGWLEAHVAAHREPSVTAVVGQVLQPGEQPAPLPPPAPRDGFLADIEFPFRSTVPAEVANVMAGNLSVKRAAAIGAGGFDANFVGGAYRFETEFARRLRRRGGTILFEPAASIRHLRAASGGTRKVDLMRSPSPHHAVGDYYFAALEGTASEASAYARRRLARNLWARYYAWRPWWLPVRLLAEWRAWRLAGRLRASGPRHLDVGDEGLPCTT